MSEGADSNLWRELKLVLPSSTYVMFAGAAGVKEQRPFTWNDVRESFTAHVANRVRIGKLTQTTADRYAVTTREFEVFLGERNISLLEGIDKRLIETFKVWRFERIKKRKQARGGTGLALDVAILHRVFAVAIENELAFKNPVRMDDRPGGNPERGAQPFSGEELSKLREHAGQDSLALLLLRWTALRGSDAVGITWGEIHFKRRELERITQKRKKQVLLPIHPELMFLLEAEYEKRKPQSSDRILMNPATGKSLSRPRLYQRMLSLGRRAGVPNAHPHRFRDTLAVDMLARGASPYDVAKVLGDTIHTVEKHYMPFVRELRERVRTILETGIGIEEPNQTPSQQRQNGAERPN